MYVDKNMEQSEMAEELGCSQTTISNYILKYDIQKPWKDEEKLRTLYWDEGLSTRQIADKLDCGQGTIIKQMSKMDIERRSVSESIKGERNGFYGETHSEEYREYKSEEMKGWHEDNEHPMQGRSHSEEAKEAIGEKNSGEGGAWYGESRPEHSERMKAESNPNWQGGHVEYYGPSFTASLKEDVRDRDNRECQLCGTDEEELERRLDIHHQVPFRKFGLENHEEANDKQNLVSLCRTCHAPLQGRETSIPTQNNES